MAILTAKDVKHDKFGTGKKKKKRNWEENG